MKLYFAENQNETRFRFKQVQINVGENHILDLHNQ